MVLPIPYAMEYSSTLRGAVLKVVHCEQCQVEYFYRLERTGQGTGTSLLFLDNEGAAGRATVEAHQSLTAKLERGVDLVPCPSCGWYQRDMLPRARREYRRWMFYVAACLTFGLFPLAFLGAIFNSVNPDSPPIPWPLFIAVVAVLGSLGVGLWLVRFVSCRRYDPNRLDVELRKRLGKARALRREDLDKLTKDQQVATHEAPTDLRTNFPGLPASLATTNSIDKSAASTPPRPAPVSRPGMCIQCGVVNPSSKLHCASCGSKLPIPVVEPRPWWQFW